MIVRKTIPMRVLLILIPLWIVALLLSPWPGLTENPAKPAVGHRPAGAVDHFAGQMSTADICATVYNCLGFDPEMTVPDRAGRPMSIAHGGRPIRETLA